LNSPQFQLDEKLSKIKKGFSQTVLIWLKPLLQASFYLQLKLEAIQ